MAIKIVGRYRVSIKFACNCVGISESCYYYKPKLGDENDLVAKKLVQLTTEHKRWGFGLCYSYLRNVLNYKWNHKRIYRIYKELDLNLRIKPRKRLKRDKPEALAIPTAVNQVWSMDFITDGLADGRTIRTFNVIDDYNRECPTIDVDLSLPSARVIRALNQVIEWRGKPCAIRCDNGPEYVSAELIKWSVDNGINILYIQPGKPTQNAYIERFNRTARHEWLDLYLFDSVTQAQDLATKWMWSYNNERPNTAIGGVPPSYLLKAA